MKRRLASFTADSVEINVSPLIDMVFILLIFFI
ncbi:MAG: biopolymer transporter ExbD, partial [Opitutae bacterium]|nr:biopolymer transporter ExbD [Opitutae bacterium]